MRSRNIHDLFRHVERTAFCVSITMYGYQISSYVDWASVALFPKIGLVIVSVGIFETARRQFWHWTRDKSRQGGLNANGAQTDNRRGPGQGL